MPYGGLRRSYEHRQVCPTAHLYEALEQYLLQTRDLKGPTMETLGIRSRHDHTILAIMITIVGREHSRLVARNAWWQPAPAGCGALAPPMLSMFEPTLRYKRPSRFAPLRRYVVTRASKIRWWGKKPNPTSDYCVISQTLCLILAVTSTSGGASARPAGDAQAGAMLLLSTVALRPKRVHQREKVPRVTRVLY